MTTAVISNYLENKIINHVLRNTAYTTPGTSVYVALYTSNPGEDNSGTEASGGDYARIQVTAWNAPSNGATYNSNAINFATASASWGEITHIGILDLDTGGNLLFYGELTVHKVIGSGDTFSIASADLDVSLGGAFSYYLANALLSHVLRNTEYTSPGTSIYAGLYTSDPGADNSGTELTIGSNAYARNQITAWDAPADGDTENTSLEAWSAASGGNWGIISHIGILDNSTGGNLLFFGALGASKTVNDGDTFQFAAGALDITVS